MEEISSCYSGNEDNDCSDSSMELIGRKVSKRKQFCIYSDSSSDDCNDNVMIGRKRTRNPAKWDRNVQKQKKNKWLSIQKQKWKINFCKNICRYTMSVFAEM